MSNSNDPHGTITVEQAVSLTTNWRQFLASSKQPFNKHSFLIPIEAIKGILEHTENAEGIRAYIGLEKADDPDLAKLALVAVVNGEDVITSPDDPSISYVYDYTSACPPYCPVINPLNG